MFTVPNVPENTVLVHFDVLFAYIFEAVRTSLQLLLLPRPAALPERGNGGLVRAAGRA